MTDHHVTERHSPLDDACFLDALERVLERGICIEAHIGVDVVGLRLVDVHCTISVSVEERESTAPASRASFRSGTFGPGFLRGGMLGSDRGDGPTLPDHLRN